MAKYLVRLLSMPLIAGALALGATLLLLKAGKGTPRRLAITFNKYVLNPGMLWLAARRPTYYAALHHVGRRSGRSYTTPVVAKLVGAGTAVIPLPYGRDTDWCRNVLAAGGGTLTFKGQEYRLSEPELIDATVGERLVPRPNAWLWHRVGIRQYLRFRAAPAVAPVPDIPRWHDGAAVPRRGARRHALRDEGSIGWERRL